LYEAYAYLSLEQGLVSQADEGMLKVEALTSPTDYQAFLKRYHEKKAFIEKQRDAFR
jgi:predicted ATP-dependent protease